MYYNHVLDCKLSGLGFGLMRLPCLSDGSIDQAQMNRMVDLAIENGVNYFDTAYPYHKGFSEIATREALKRYPRESYYLATKFPGHIVAESYDPAKVFENQLKKCGVEYFDFYLLHNVCENSMDVYEDPKWGIIDYFVEQKRLGRIRHLGFSTHAQMDTMESFLDRHGEHMEFCQIQMNYLDWTLQDAKGKYEMLTRRGIPVVVMESVRGGRLASLSEGNEAKLKALRPDASIASWALRFLQGLPNVAVILSGMSDEAQMLDNIRTFTDRRPTTDAENGVLFEIAEELSRAVPCTACRYCCDGCPVGLDIPALIKHYNDATVAPSLVVGMYLDSLPADKLPSACIGCGQCSAICPQKIDIPGVMAAFTEKRKSLPNWNEISRIRVKDAAAMEETL